MHGNIDNEEHKEQNMIPTYIFIIKEAGPCLEVFNWTETTGDVAHEKVKQRQGDLTKDDSFKIKKWTISFDVNIAHITLYL